MTGATTASDQTAVSPPVAVVVHGAASPEEVAALVAVLSAASGAGDDSSRDQRTSTWAAHSVAMRRPVGHGPGAWRTSLRG